MTNSISVIVVTYNAALTLQKCLDSIYKQAAVKDIKIIVMDGDSNDGTVEILKRNKEKIFFWKSEKDTGIYDAMNKALQYVTTNWVYFLGADDELLPDFSRLINELADPKSVYYSNVIYKNEKHSGEVSVYHQAKLGIFHQSIIYPSAIFKKYKYNTSYKIAADYALNMKLNKDKDYHFEYKDYTIAKYNDTGISSAAIDVNFEKDKTMLILNNFDLKVWARYLFRRIKAKVFNGRKG